MDETSNPDVSGENQPAEPPSRELRRRAALTYLRTLSLGVSLPLAGALFVLSGVAGPASPAQGVIITAILILSLAVSADAGIQRARRVLHRGSAA